MGEHAVHHEGDDCDFVSFSKYTRRFCQFIFCSKITKTFNTRPKICSDLTLLSCSAMILRRQKRRSYGLVLKCTILISSDLWLFILKLR